MSELIRREDAIKATWKDPSYTDPINVLTEVRDRINAIPAATRWHRVDEELPKQGEWVLVKSCLVRMMTDFIDKTGRWYRTPGVTHWMPLPEPPNEVQE